MKNAPKSRRDAPRSSSYLEHPSPDFRKTEKWSTPNIDYDGSFTPSPKFPANQRGRLHEDQGSEDNHSYRSGVTGKASHAEFDHLSTQKPDEHFSIAASSSLRGMKPPIRKRDSKEVIPREPSVLTEEFIRPSINVIESISHLEGGSFNDIGGEASISLEATERRGKQVVGGESKMEAFDGRKRGKSEGDARVVAEKEMRILRAVD
ncbi:unnamed protein product [Sphagnum balticum]